MPAAANSNARDVRFQPSNSAAVAPLMAAPNAERIQDPTLIGEVTLKTRSMFRNRCGTPRSAISSTGATSTPANAARRWTLARPSSPRKRAQAHCTAAAPAMPPTQKYVGMYHFHTCALTTGRP